MKEALFYERLQGDNVRCRLCNHFCVIPSGKIGKCGVRQNNGGVLHSLTYGNIIAEHCDPIEKKPLYHFLPNSTTYSVAAPGCNFRCRFCQNWQISQVRENRVRVSDENSAFLERVLKGAHETDCKSIAFTYSEPTVFYEVIKEIESYVAGGNPLYFVVVSNGYMSSACLDEMNRFVHAYNIDLKAFSDKKNRKNCGATLKPVLENIKKICNDNIWLELTTMLIPGENDSMEEIEKIASFIAETDPNIPWHVSRFFPNYKFQTHRITGEKILNQAREIGKRHGLKYIYTGNTSQTNYTTCPKCSEELIERSGYRIVVRKSFKNGICARCGEIIVGVW